MGACLSTHPQPSLSFLPTNYPDKQAAPCFLTLALCVYIWVFPILNVFVNIFSFKSIQTKFSFDDRMPPLEYLGNTGLERVFRWKAAIGGTKLNPHSCCLKELIYSLDYGQVGSGVMLLYTVEKSLPSCPPYILLRPVPPFYPPGDMEAGGLLSEEACWGLPIAD